MENPNQRQLALPVNWDFGSVGSKYATNMLVQSGEHEMFLGFFEVRPPTVFKEADLAAINSVTAECVARIIVSADKMQSFIDAMQQNLDAYLALKSQRVHDGGSDDS